jgi:serine/threonine-protein kinase
MAGGLGLLRFGPYFLDSRIAVGGTAEVYLAHPIDPRAEPRRLVVKRLLPDFLASAEGRTMFEREARLHAAIHSDAVVEVYGSGVTDEGEPYLSMEYVEGIDGYRLLRKIKTDGSVMPPAVAIYVARELLRALAAVHSAKDARGRPLGIVHRDVSPSNLYFASDGSLKLGDFGIARDSSRPQRSQSESLKGKYAYLAPEQVAGEPFDGRADLFSAAVCLAEMILGEPLFSGAGQLAVLLAIRDCRIDPLLAAKSRLPGGLFDVMAQALSRNPEDRYPTAEALRKALEPFDRSADFARKEIGRMVMVSMRKESQDRMMAIRDSARHVPIAKPVELADDSDYGPSERATGEYTTEPSFVETRDGRKFGPWTFAALVEAIATSVVARGDRVSYMGASWRVLEQIEELLRFLPPDSSVTTDVRGPKAEWTIDFNQTSMLEALLRVLERDETGALFATDAPQQPMPGSSRKELYFVRGRLHHVASSASSELLGEYLVRRGTIAREELDMALAVLPRHDGRMGDTLISLGLCDAMTLFRAIREQGRDRVADLFVWKQGRIAFYRAETAPHVEFPLDLDATGLVMAGMEAAYPGDEALEKYRPLLQNKLSIGLRDRVGLTHVRWPQIMMSLQAAARRELPYADAMRDTALNYNVTPADVCRHVEVLRAAHLVEIG